MQLYDTLTKQLQDIEPTDTQPIRMYTCGPTVYNFSHIGNLRSFIIPDVLYRTIKHSGQKIEWVINITDIDDKTILGTVAEYGQEANVTDLQHFTKKYYDAFLEDLRGVNVSVDEIKFIPATSLMNEIQAFIMDLVEKGLAYKAEDGSTYFSIEQFQARYGNYGKLIGEKFLEGKKTSVRINNDEYEKENPSDFALWKAHSENDANIFWHHPALGKGRPGWHIECSVINKVGFGGKPTDIHTGGVDLIFPHHTNEIAQSEPFGPFVKHWMHIEHIQVDNKKMAKRLKNFYTLKDIVGKGFTGTDLRYMFLQGHYKSQQNFTWDALQASHNAIQKLSNAFEHGATDSENHAAVLPYVNKIAADQNDDKPSSAILSSGSRPIDTDEKSQLPKFVDALNKDLSTAQAISVVWEDKAGIKTYTELLGLKLEHSAAVEIPEEIQKLLNDRQTYRNAKNFAKSDELRDMIEKLGYDINDTPEGQTVTKK